MRQVIIGLTVLAYRYEGLRRRDMITIIKALKEQLSSEKGPMSERPTAIIFRRYSGRTSAEPEYAYLRM